MLYILHHNPCLNLLLCHYNQRREIKKRHTFTFQHTVFYRNFLPATKKSTTTFLLLRKFS